jgi:uncharacterized protein
MRPEGRFDGFGVAARQAVIAGQLDAAALPRVADLLAEDVSEGGQANVEYRITGSADAGGRPALAVSLSGAVPLTCQRCLRPFRWPVEQSTLLLLARDVRELALLDDDDHEHEVLLAAAPLDPVALVEDELLLTLPFAPRCPEAECPAAGTLPPAARKTEDGASPFGALAGLKAAAGKKARR